MTRRPSLVAAFALGAIASAGVTWSARPGVARQPPAAAADAIDAGRFRIAVTDTGSSVFVLDSVTGQCWRRSGMSRWADLGSPVEARD